MDSCWLVVLLRRAVDCRRCPARVFYGEPLPFVVFMVTTPIREPSYWVMAVKLAVLLTYGLSLAITTTCPSGEELIELGQLLGNTYQWLA